MLCLFCLLFSVLRHPSWAAPFVIVFQMRDQDPLRSAFDLFMQLCSNTWYQQRCVGLKRQRSSVYIDVEGICAKQRRHDERTTNCFQHRKTHTHLSAPVSTFRCLALFSQRGDLRADSLLLSAALRVVLFSWPSSLAELTSCCCREGPAR